MGKSNRASKWRITNPTRFVKVPMRAPIRKTPNPKFKMSQFVAKPTYLKGPIKMQGLKARP